jgi:hypothetical protein
MRQHLGFGQADDIPGRDRDPMQAVALRVDAEVAERGVLLAQDLARLRRVLADPSLRAACSAPVRAGDLERAPQERVELSGTSIRAMRQRESA